MRSLSQRVQTESKLKLFYAGAGVLATLGLALWSLTAALLASLPTAFLFYRWWRHRLEHGLRF